MRKICELELFSVFPDDANLHESSKTVMSHDRPHFSTLSSSFSTLLPNILKTNKLWIWFFHIYFTFLCKRVAKKKIKKILTITYRANDLKYVFLNNHHHRWTQAIKNLLWIFTSLNKKCWDDFSGIDYVSRVVQIISRTIKNVNKIWIFNF